MTDTGVPSGAVVDTIVVPEPSSVALFAVGGVAVAAGLRRRRR